MSTLMALLYGFLWRLLLVLVYVNRALVSLLRVWFRSWKDRLSERVTTALLLPVALTGFPDHRKKLNHNPNANASPVSGNYAAGSRSRWLSDGRSLEKLPVHIGLLVAEEEPSYTDIANLVVWCMAVGISYVSVYDNHGIFRKNNSHLLEEIVQQQQDLLGVDGSKYSVEFLSNASDMHQHHVVSCRPTVKVLSPEDGKQSIVQAAQQLCRSVENKQRRSKDISVSMLDILLRGRSHLLLFVRPLQDGIPDMGVHACSLIPVDGPRALLSDLRGLPDPALMFVIFCADDWHSPSP
ncbi:dehydrodolichyl diphosphate synthase complex subunit nus1 isoform X2 [Echeneis naucrates]|uniref:dehydrodolichyl diphosphate synthase complex subunit nus1 isoform X2 n=1 Tax=Echeneis naucrates TaxID=173247 RepID=UPI001113B8B3|nr:dehydrodolichyl diphosphate synthase complex subunit NUS1 isoform X2 [Echeneis naucrates]